MGRRRSESTRQEPGLLREYLYFLRYEKRWYLLPFVVLLVVLAAFFFVAGDTTAPFVYTLF